MALGGGVALTVHLFEKAKFAWGENCSFAAFSAVNARPVVSRWLVA